MQAPVCAAKQLRPYQIEAVNQVMSIINGGSKSVLVVAPPGAGKTVIALQLAKRAIERGRRVLFVAHRRELIAQASKTFDEAGIDHGVVMAGHRRYRPELPLQIATVQTLWRRIGGAPKADLVMVDEAHLAVASSYLQVLDNAYPKAKRLGFTGTPERLDGKGLDQLFDDLVHVVTAQVLIDQGHLIEPVVFAPNERLDLSRVTTKLGDYSERDLDALVNNAALCGDIVDHWHKHAEGMSTIAFAVNQAHSQRIVDQFNYAGVKSEHVDCHTAKADRDAILGRLRSGETTLVSNVDILTEGFDYPALQCVILARPTKSYPRYLQSVGRVMRPAPGKTRAVCLDHAGSVFEHGFPSDPRGVSLAGANDEISGPKVEPCPRCAAVIRTTAPKCLDCGWKRPLPPVLEEKVNGPRNSANDDGELVKFDKESRSTCPACGSYQVREFRNAKLGPFTVGVECRDRTCRKTKYRSDAAAVAEANAEEKSAEYQRLTRIQTVRGWAPTWVNQTFKKTFGHYPTQEAM